MEKMTKKEKFAEIIADLEKAQVADLETKVEFLNHEIELLSRKRKDNTALQETNAKFIEQIVTFMKDNGTIQASALMVIDGINSTSKASALLKKMVENGMVEKRVEKGKTYFSLV